MTRAVKVSIQAGGIVIISVEKMNRKVEREKGIERRRECRRREEEEEEDDDDDAGEERRAVVVAPDYL